MKLNEITSTADEPVLVRIVNNYLNKGGSVMLDIKVLPSGRRHKGWIAKPITGEQALSFAPTSQMTYKVVTKAAADGAVGKIAYLSSQPDIDYTIKNEVDKGGNKYLRVTNRETT